MKATEFWLKMNVQAVRISLLLIYRTVDLDKTVFTWSAVAQLVER